jgi:hypothetical protein
VNERHIVRLSLRFHFAQDGEILPSVDVKPATQLFRACFHEVEERALLPAVGRRADVGRSVFDGRGLLDAIGSSPKRTAFVNRMQRIDEERGAGKRDSFAPAALAEAVPRFPFGCAEQTCLDQPAFDGAW